MFLTTMKPGSDLHVRDNSDRPVVPQDTARTLQDDPEQSVQFISGGLPDVCVSFPPTHMLTVEDVDVQKVQYHQLYCLSFDTALVCPRTLCDPCVATLTSTVC